MSDSFAEDLRVDVLLLPSLNDAAFWIIVLVILGTIISAAVGANPILMWPVTLSLIILPVRTFLAQPRKEFELINIPATEAFADKGILTYLQQEVDQLVEEIDYKHKVQLLISCRPDEARAFGTWRQHYIFIGNNLAEKLHADLQGGEQRPKAQALLSHELAHHLHKDVQRIGYTRVLLRDCFVLLGWWALFLMGLFLLSYLALPAVLALDLSTIPGVDPASAAVLTQFDSLITTAKAETAEKLDNISIGLILNSLIYTFLPIIIIGAALWLFYWRRMVRQQEYYADWLSTQTIGSTTFLLRAFGRYPAWFRPSEPQEASSGAGSLGLFGRQKQSLASGTTSSWPGRSNRTWKRWFALHPSYRDRYAYLADPLRLHESWGWEALAITTLVVALEILLISPAAGYYLSSFPIHFVTITVLILVSTWLLPLMANERPFQSPLIKMLLVIFTVRGVWLLINVTFLIISIVVFPDWASGELNNLVLAMSRVAQQPESLPITNIGEVLLWLPGMLALQFMPFIAVCLGLAIYYLANRRDFNQGAAQEINWRKRHWLSVILISAFLVLALLGPITAVYFNELSSSSLPWHLLSFIIGLLLLFVLWFSRRWSSL